MKKNNPNFNDLVVVKPTINKYEETPLINKYEEILLIGKVIGSYKKSYFIKYKLPQQDKFNNRNVFKQYFSDSHIISKKDILYHSTDMEKIKSFINEKI